MTSADRNAALEACRRTTYMVVVAISVAASVLNAQSLVDLGCWSDPDAANRDVSGVSRSMGSNAKLSDCATYCIGAQYPYVGLQFGSQCMCGSSYGRHGTSADCNFTCSKNTCGGYMANSVYYALDSDLSSQRQLILQTTHLSFSKARSGCVGGDGDLEAPSSSGSIRSMMNLIPVNSTDITSVWVGLWRRVPGGSYEWTNPNQRPAYSTSAFAALWTSGDAQTMDCVSLNIATQRLESSDCAKQKPSVCRQLSNADAETESPTTAAPSTGLSADSKKLALFIVLPMFLCCYGGSCIIYCVHKIIHNCAKAKRMQITETDDDKPASLLAPSLPPALPQATGLGARAKMPMMVKPMGGEGIGGFPTKIRPLSSGRRSASVSPAPPTSFMETTEPRRPVTPIQHEMKTKADDPSDIGLKPLSAQPPPYVDREEARRARLLENAAKEARERKQAREGSAVSRPATAAITQPSPEPNVSDTAKLLSDSPPPPSGPTFDKPPSPRSQGTTTPQGLAGMSINDILKMKMAQKADGKKKPRKILTT